MVVFIPDIPFTQGSNSENSYAEFSLSVAGCLRGALSSSCGEGLGGVAEVAAEVLHPVAGDGFGDVAGPDAADDFGAAAGTGDGHVEQAPPGRPAQRAEVRGDLALLVRPVADGQDQHVPFLALRGRCALDEEPA